MSNRMLDFFFKKGRPSPSYPTLPAVSENGESSIPGLYLIGDAAGKPLIKLALNDGFDLGSRLAEELEGSPKGAADYDVAVAGAGVAGMATALRLHELGLSVVAIDAGRAFQTLRNFTKGKKLFAEPLDIPLQGSFPFEEGLTDDVLAGFDRVTRDSGLEVREFTKVTDIRRDPAGFRVITQRGEITARRVVVSIGKSGNPRKAGVPGELEYPEKIAHFLKDPADYRGKRILIYGGGDVAAEAALALCEHNAVTLATIDAEFVFPKKRNIDAMFARRDEGRLDIRFNAWLKGIGPEKAVLEQDGEKVEIDNDFVFEMIGAEPPIGFFKQIGIKMEGAWDARRWITLAVSAVAVFLLYSFAKYSPLAIPGLYGLGIKDLPMPLAHPSFWYAGLYTVVMTTFGLAAMKRWSRGWKDTYQITRFASLIFFQIASFIGIEALLGVYMPTSWWRAYAVNNPFPLLFDSFTGLPDLPVDPGAAHPTLAALQSFYDFSGLTRGHVQWILAGLGLLMTLVAIPIFVRRHGKRFCTWVCGCGGLAETLGDRWRHLSPKGERARRLESMNWVVLFWVAVSAGIILVGFGGQKDEGVARVTHAAYSMIADFLLVAVIPVALYPIWGGKIWCRYWCPLAKYMQILSKWYGRLSIASNEKCIQCTQCSKYCQVGVDVMAFAKNGQSFSNRETSCIHCGICITVCPMDVLRFELMPTALRAAPGGAPVRAAASRGAELRDSA